MGGSTAAQISSSVVKRNGVVVAFLSFFQLWLFCCSLYQFCSSEDLLQVHVELLVSSESQLKRPPERQHASLTSRNRTVCLSVLDFSLNWVRQVRLVCYQLNVNDDDDGINATDVSDEAHVLPSCHSNPCSKLSSCG